MSLLMDALKKAEEAKRQAGETNASATQTEPVELTLQPVTPPAPGQALPNLSQKHLDSVDADLATVSTTAPARKRQTASAPKPATDNTEAIERSAARNVFAAKQPPKSRAPLWIFLGMVGIATAGIGGYFWWQFQSMSGGSLARPSLSPQTNTISPSPQAPVQPTITIAEVRKPEPPLLPSLPEPAKPQIADPAPLPEKRERPTPQTAATQNETDSPIRLSSSIPKQNPALNRAYEALQADKTNDAKRDYEQVLRSDPKNTDALLGLATIAARQGQVNNATELYLRVLEADPKDVNAKAGLINLKGQSDPALAESRLKTLLASQPDSATLNFALGNLHASQVRWSEAQQAYFRAHTAEPENADYLFNLAVSLDHLHQNKLAAQYYSSALTAAETRNAAFDRNQVRTRLLELRP